MCFSRSIRYTPVRPDHLEPDTARLQIMWIEAMVSNPCIAHPALACRLKKLQSKVQNLV